MCGDRHIIRWHCRRNFFVPTHKGITLSCRVSRSGDRRAVILSDGGDFTASGGIKCYCVLIDFPLRRDRHNLCGHFIGEWDIPADEGIALSRRIIRDGDGRAIILIDNNILLTVFEPDSDYVRKDVPSGVQRHIPWNRVVKVPHLCAVGILIPATEVVAFPYRLFIGFLDTLVLLFLARFRTGQCAAVRIEGDRAKGCLLPQGIQGTVLRFVICVRATAVFIAVLPAAPLFIIPATEKISLVSGYRHLFKIPAICDLHCVLRHRTATGIECAAVGIEGNGVQMEGPLRRQRDARYGIVSRKVGICGSRKYISAVECPARKIIAGFCRIGNAF